MNNKKAKSLRKRLGLKLPVAPDYRIFKQVEKEVVFKDALGLPVVKKAVRTTIVNNAKHQYRQLKKLFR